MDFLSRSPPIALIWIKISPKFDIILTELMPHVPCIIMPNIRNPYFFTNFKEIWLKMKEPLYVEVIGIGSENHVFVTFSVAAKHFPRAVQRLVELNL